MALSAATATGPRWHRRTHSEDPTSVTYVIAEPCVDTMELSCVAVCPVDCIHYDEGVDRMLYIDPNECIDCGACEPECSVAAIKAEDALPPEWEPYTEINALWFTDKEAARARLDALKPRVGACA
jgi:NAD-dependent dihydropyrimidine dehydrogenase PreA subunit